MTDVIIAVFVFAWFASMPYILRMLKRVCRKLFDMVVDAVLNWIDVWKDVFDL